ncbi:N-acetylmuramic acid 6-phosphate etherase [Carnobacterium iners]|uniref:N-acetylmuramic acid 6-phosphate etherase n=1 Tax=Carnobacterium iners TaxID=1073423 RepID=A0A1X7N561_9LACT|nr:N-acetylmuramic acid 6-phosphate etherase [Carnobacterium iners]SEK43829.1 N-acetylmuramic acid 6-phosphate etherase [Carnobacterium iners]SMH32580.1 N-acetylmuramic acid 6-phosphate etherase [Carnobacterium iners]
MNLEKLATETRNKQTMHLDELSVLEMMQLMNQEDQTVAEKVADEIPQITKVVEAIIKSFNQGGRLIYIGAGTSGRLGVLDAAECVPTFSVNPNMVQGLIAGGMKAMTVAVEGAEDSKEFGKEDLKKIDLSENDIVIGIAASGRTPYVIGGLKYAKEIGAMTATISCNKQAEISKYAQLPIEVEVGPEILTGSTRLKSGTAQKLVLNMLSTGAMIGIGKVYQNLMVDVKPSNKKLEERSKRIIMEATNCSYELASQTFIKAEQQVKLAIVMLLTHSSKEEAEKKLTNANGFIRKTI